MSDDELRDIFTAAEGMIEAQGRLLAYYRTSTHPSEAFWRRYEAARDRWAVVQALKPSQET